jgi:DNA-binding winged helix-turn-helix (wHTH) protein
MQEVWETDYVDDTRTLEVHISWLRKKLGDGENFPKVIYTVRGVGYQFGPSRWAAQPPESEERASNGSAGNARRRREQVEPFADLHLQLA